MRNLLAKILFFVSTVLLYYHQSVAHHHQDFEIASEHHSDWNTGHDEDHLPPHHIAHVFSADQVKISVTKVFSSDLFFAHQYDISLFNKEQVLTKKEYVEIRPPLLKGQSLHRSELYWYYPHYSPQLGRPAAAIRQGDWKLILFFEDSRAELYHLADDLAAQHDLASQQPDRAKRLRSKLEAWLVETKDQLPYENPNYDPRRKMEAGPPLGPVPAK